MYRLFLSAREESAVNKPQGKAFLLGCVIAFGFVALIIGASLAGPNLLSMHF